ncbi:MAG: iron-sulfur cluster insertion protein ErpA [Anaerolineales bacterium]|nr:iron-sulfur cluster insertion protein ErpA [Anaerolineales bacterium]
MNIVEQSDTQTVTLTSAAADAVRELMARKNLENYALRVYVAGGGCSGFQYGMALDNNIRETDQVSETDGIKMIIDEVSIKYMHGATIDYAESVMGAGFKITNPNAISSCGCGQSFDSSQGGGCGGCSSS